MGAPDGAGFRRGFAIVAAQRAGASRSTPPARRCPPMQRTHMAVGRDGKQVDSLASPGVSGECRSPAMDDSATPPAPPAGPAAGPAAGFRPTREHVSGRAWPLRVLGQFSSLRSAALLISIVALVTGAGSGLGDAIAKGLLKEGVKVWASDINLETMADLPEGVQRVVLPSSAEAKPGNYVDRARDLESAIRKHEIDVMVYHAWVSKILLWDLLACKTAGAAFVTHCHSSFSQPARSGRTYFADMPAVFHLSDAVIALSEVDHAYWSTFSDNVVSMVNPLTFELGDLKISSLQTKSVLWLGRMSDEKRPHDALRIFAKVLEEEPDAKLHMVGSCPEPEYMEGMRALVDELGMQDSVVLHGFHRNVLPFYAGTSLLLMTSEFEGFSMTISESQSFGIPCVMYDLPYLTLTRARKGFIAVEMGDLNAATDGVVALLRDPERRQALGQEARDNIESIAKFDFAGAWSGVFDGLSRATEERPLDEATRIMWDTLLDHYRLGAVPRNRELNRVNKDLAVAERSRKTRAGARTEMQRIRASWSFRIGHAITFVPRALRRMVGRLLSGGDR